MKKRIIILVSLVLMFISGIVVTIIIGNKKTKLIVFDWKSSENIEIGKIKTKEYSSYNNGFNCIPDDHDKINEVIESYFSNSKKQDFSIYKYDEEIKGTLYFQNDNYYFYYKKEGRVYLEGLYSNFMYEPQSADEQTFVFDAVVPYTSYIQTSTIEYLEKVVFKYSFEELCSFYSNLMDYSLIDSNSKIISVKGYINKYSEKRLTNNYVLEIDYNNKEITINKE